VSGEVGAAARQRRLDLGLTLDTVAAAIGTDKGTLSNLERGFAAIDVDRLQDLADALDCDPADLLPKRRRRRAASAS
jgi:transcriptional regulator with XRE-family HTH domain